MPGETCKTDRSNRQTLQPGDAHQSRLLTLLIDRVDRNLVLLSL
ncbi:hypothetical protein [Phormidesmis priestleyi]